MRKDFSHHLSEHIVTWLLQFSEKGANSLELEDKEAKQPKSRSREGVTDKAIGKGHRELNPVMPEGKVSFQPGKWTNMLRDIQYLRELTMLKAICRNLDNKELSRDPGEVKCTRPI